MKHPLNLFASGFCGAAAIAAIGDWTWFLLLLFLAAANFAIWRAEKCS